jgi:hypothetical protein
MSLFALLDVEFREAFLLTYRTFVTPTVLLDMISQRVRLPAAAYVFCVDWCINGC